MGFPPSKTYKETKADTGWMTLESTWQPIWSSTGWYPRQTGSSGLCFVTWHLLALLHSRLLGFLAELALLELSNITRSLCLCEPWGCTVDMMGIYWVDRQLWESLKWDLGLCCLQCVMGEVLEGTMCKPSMAAWYRIKLLRWQMLPSSCLLNCTHSWRHPESSGKEFTQKTFLQRSYWLWFQREWPKSLTLYKEVTGGLPNTKGSQVIEVL